MVGELALRTTARLTPADVCMCSAIQVQQVVQVQPEPEHPTRAHSSGATLLDLLGSVDLLFWCW